MFCPVVAFTISILLIVVVLAALEGVQRKTVIPLGSSISSVAAEVRVDYLRPGYRKNPTSSSDS